MGEGEHPNERSKWNKDNQLEAKCHLVIAPPTYFFDKELEFNELQVTPETQPTTGHTNIISPKKLFGMELEVNKDPVRTSPKLDIKDQLHTSWTRN
jgi:hypothetical protein